MKALSLTQFVTTRSRSSPVGHTRLVAKQPKFKPFDPATLLIEIVIPVYNEEVALPVCIAKLNNYMAKNLPYRYKITIADNASTDKTWKVAQKLARATSTVEAMHLEQKGRGGALKAVWQASDADILTYMDVDLSTGLDSFKPMIEPLISGHAAIATGSRLQKTAQTTRSLKREIISRGYNFIVRWSMRSHFSDAQCGFKAIRNDVAKVLLPTVHDEAWFFDTELLVKAERHYGNSSSVHEVAVEWVEDPDSRVNIITTARDDIRGLLRIRRELRVESEHAINTAQKVGLAMLLLATFALYAVDLSHNGYANSYYSAAVQAAHSSWKALFFGSTDAANFITIDKPPLAIWVMGLSTRLFGFSSWSILLPSALAGVGSVALLYASVKRFFDYKSAMIAGALLAVAPVAVLLFRYNNPDSFLTLLLLASAYAFTRSLDTNDRSDVGRKPRPLLWLSLAGFFTGLAFNTKMLQGLVLLPVMALTYLICAKPKLAMRIKHLLIAGVVAAVSALGWVVIVWLIPASSRPYIGSSSKNSIWDLILGYNGFGRLLGKNNTLSEASANIVSSPGNGSGYSGHTGFLRMFNSQFGPNIGWLIPLAIISAALIFWLLRRSARDNTQRAAAMLWAGWLILHMLLFSFTGGVIHPYYAIVIAPAVAALIGIGLPYIWTAYSKQTTIAWILPLAVAASAITSFDILNYGTDFPGLSWMILSSGAFASLIFLIKTQHVTDEIKRVAVVLSIFVALAGPLAFTASTVVQAHSGSVPNAGPKASALAYTSDETANANDALISYLVAHRGGATWLVAVTSANESAPIQISSGQPVMALGGFSGSDNTLTLPEFQSLVASGKVSYFAVNTGRDYGGKPRVRTTAISRWATTYGTAVDYGGSGTALYKLSNKSPQN